MRDPLSWSLGLGRWFGVRVRVHLFFVLLALLALLMAATHDPPLLRLGLTALLLLFASIVLHEFGHVAAARFTGGEAEEVLIWPLGGLASVETDHSPRSHFVTAFAGPAVHFGLCAALGTALTLTRQPLPLNPIRVPLEFWNDADAPWVGVVALGFWINLLCLLFNLLPAFPLDCGRMLRAALWPRMGFGRATLVAVVTGRCVAILLFFLALLPTEHLDKQYSVGLIVLGIFIFYATGRERQLLEQGLLFDDSVFGYDFSQGYTSLDQTAEPQHPQPRVSAWKRWKAHRAQLKRERQLAQQREDERRVDELLVKVKDFGYHSLTEEEKRFLQRASVRYRDRKLSHES